MEHDDKYDVKGYALGNIIRNKNELRVVKTLNKILGNFPDFCACNICLEDLYALTLNSLNPRYQHHMSIVLNSKDISDKELESKIAENIEKVSDNKNHPD